MKPERLFPIYRNFLRLLMLAMLSGNVMAGNPIKTEEFALQEWQIGKISCPVGCDHDLKLALQSFVGSKVQIGPNQFSGAMFEACDGPTEVTLKQQSKQEMLNELKQVLLGETKFNANNLQLPPQVVSAMVYCQGTNGVVGGSGARIVSIEEKRVLILFAEQALLELRRVP